MEYAAQARRYKRLRELGLCTSCGREKDTRTVLCEVCRRKVLDKRHAAYLERTKNAPPKIARAPLPRKKRVRKRAAITRECVGCGNSFESRRGKRYCESCSYKDCAQCGRSFLVVRPSELGTYCSKACYNEAMRSQRGESARNWRGGRMKEKELIRGRAEYKDWRRSVFERDGWRCQDCGKKCGDGKRVYLHAHHIKEFSTHPELRMELSNGLTLCKPCHYKRHRKEK